MISIFRCTVTVNRVSERELFAGLQSIDTLSNNQKRNRMLKIDVFKNSLKPDQLLIRFFSKNRSNVILVTEV